MKIIYWDTIRNLLEEYTCFGIVGFGLEGKSTYQVLRKIFPDREINIYDNKKDSLGIKEILSDKLVHFHFGSDYLSSITKCEVIFKSPGVKTEVIRKYVGDSRKITSQADVFLEIFNDRIIGITGTKGKSTTSSLIYGLLQTEKHVLLNGNIGVPFFDCIDDIKSDTIFVSEMSCHQLQNVTKSPHISVITNIFQEHLDYYPSMNDYVQAKLNIIKYQCANDYFIADMEGSQLKDYVTIPTSKVTQINMGGRTKLPDGFGELSVSNDVIRWEHDGYEDMIKLNHNILGEHNKFDQMLAVAAAIICGLTKKSIEQGIEAFKGLPHRIEYIGTIGGARFYNDSISTIPETAIQAIEALGQVDTIILGGLNRGIDYNPFINYLKEIHVKNIICIGEVGQLLYDNLREVDLLNIQYFKEFEKAVKMAIRLTPQNGVCILSPAATSYDQFSNFEERGRMFSDIILKSIYCGDA